MRAVFTPTQLAMRRFWCRLTGLINWPIVAAMAAGGTVGTLAGLPIAKSLGTNAVLGRRLFAGLILIVAVYVAFKAITAL